MTNKDFRRVLDKIENQVVKAGGAIAKLKSDSENFEDEKSDVCEMIGRVIELIRKASV